MKVASLNLLGDDDNNNNNINDSACWVRGTWISPNRDKRTRLPVVPDNLFFFGFKLKPLETLIYFPLFHYNDKIKIHPKLLFV